MNSTDLDADVFMAILSQVEARLGFLQFPFKQPGRVFNPPNDQKYIETVIITNNQADYWGDEKQYSGIVRVILHWPMDDEGIFYPMTICGQICATLVKGLELRFGVARLQIITVPMPLDPIPDGQEILYPVSFAYSSALAVSP